MPKLEYVKWERLGSAGGLGVATVTMKDGEKFVEVKDLAETGSDGAFLSSLELDALIVLLEQARLEQRRAARARQS